MKFKSIKFTVGSESVGFNCECQTLQEAFMLAKQKNYNHISFFSGPDLVRLNRNEQGKFELDEKELMSDFP